MSRVSSFLHLSDRYIFLLILFLQYIDLARVQHLDFGWSRGTLYFFFDVMRVSSVHSAMFNRMLTRSRRQIIDESSSPCISGSTSTSFSILHALRKMNTIVASELQLVTSAPFSISFSSASPRMLEREVVSFADHSFSRLGAHMNKRRPLRGRCASLP
jgi:hypothetical protein